MLFQLRKEHEKALAKVAQDNFEGRTADHVRKNLPKQSAGLTEQALRDRIQREAERSRRYGLTSERQIVRFVDANFLLGEHYLDGPAHQWAHELLGEKSSADDRARRLLDGAVQRAPRSGPK